MYNNLFSFLFVLLLYCLIPITSHSAASKINWFDEGWYHFNHHRTNMAASAWQQAINKLPASQPITFLGTHTNISNAIDQLQRAGQQHRAMIIQKRNHGETIYIVLSTQYIHDNHISNQSHVAFNAGHFQSNKPTFIDHRRSKNKAPQHLTDNYYSSRTILPDNGAGDGSASWIEDGWDHLLINNFSEAMNAWQQGVNSLPDDQLLIFLGVYRKPVDARRLAKRAGRDQKVIIVKGEFKGSGGYYVLSAQGVPKTTKARRMKLSTLRHSVHASGWLYGNYAKKYKTVYASTMF